MGPLGICPACHHWRPRTPPLGPLVAQAVCILPTPGCGTYLPTAALCYLVACRHIQSLRNMCGHVLLQHTDMHMHMHNINMCALLVHICIYVFVLHIRQGHTPSRHLSRPLHEPPIQAFMPVTPVDDCRLHGRATPRVRVYALFEASRSRIPTRHGMRNQSPRMEHICALGFVSKGSKC